MKNIFVSLTLLLLAACGGSSSNSGGSDTPNPSTNDNSSLGTLTHLAYDFSIQLERSGKKTTTFDFPSTYSVPLRIKSTGQVSLLTREFPRMVLRVCPVDSTRKDCDIKVDASEDSIGTGADLVMDLCGIGRAHENCGDDDPTVVTGILSSSGSLTVSSMPVRLRVFFLSGSTNGITATDRDPGIFGDMPRIVASIRTGVATSGPLTAQGMPVIDTEITLVAGGLLPNSLPELGGYGYVATMNGSFDNPPLDILE